MVGFNSCDVGVMFRGSGFCCDVELVVLVSCESSVKIGATGAGGCRTCIVLVLSLVGCDALVLLGVTGVFVE